MTKSAKIKSETQKVRQRAGMKDMGRSARMTSGNEPGAASRMASQLEVAIGEALYASTLATLTLTNQVATGRMSHEEASALLDGATLVLERHRGVDPANAGAIDYARSRVTALLNLLEQKRSMNDGARRTMAEEIPVL